MRFRLLIAGCIFSSAIAAQMPIYGADSMVNYYQEKADALMFGDTSIRKIISLDIYGITMFSSPDQSVSDMPAMDYRVTWQELSTYKNVMAFESRESAQEIMNEKGIKPFSPAIQKQYGNGILSKAGYKFRTPQKPLAGMKIAIDPGHIANDTAFGHLEQKFISMKIPSAKNPSDSVPVAFAEGQLTWQAANMLAVRLRNAGAEVMFTRKGPGVTAFGKTFDQWKKDDYKRTLDSLLNVDPSDQNLLDLKRGIKKEDRSIFRFVFRDAELRKRADIINEFHPDLTVVIHFNVDETNSPWNKPTTKNYCMLFVPGSFQREELSTREARFDFLRLLLTDDIEQSIEASGFVGKQFNERLQVPLADPSSATYLSTSCRKTTRRGVFARNLSMTRLVHGPIIYGETLYQDNAFEARRLADMSVSDAQSGLTVSKRVLEVAEAYFEGIMQWSYSK